MRFRSLHAATALRSASSNAEFHKALPTPIRDGFGESRTCPPAVRHDRRRGMCPEYASGGFVYGLDGSFNQRVQFCEHFDVNWTNVEGFLDQNGLDVLDGMGLDPSRRWVSLADDYQDRRAWFESYVARCEGGVTAAPSAGVRYPCPCCGYPMLSERGGYEICRLCNWEDDGQDDPHAEEVWGGTNGSYSLAQARMNFRNHLVMYDPGQPDTRIGGRDSRVELDAKRQIVAAFDVLRGATDESSIGGLWTAVKAGEAILEAELHRKLREHEIRHQ